MPSGAITTANIGTPWPLSYGYFRATGMQLINFTVQPTLAVPATVWPANMQIGMWDLGEGELDGCNSLWINNELQFAYDPNGNLMGNTLVGVNGANPLTTPSLYAFWFHTGCDAPFGNFTDVSGTTQEIDPLWSFIGDLVTPLCFSRRCYYTIGWTPATNNSATLSPLGDFRGMRCRIFDDSGNVTQYAFTTNPIWHFVDLWLRRAIKPEYSIPQGGMPDALTASESAMFNWPSIYAAAMYCQTPLANGQPRFQGSYVFASGSTLEAMLEQVLLCCRGYMYEYAGQIYVFVDQPRSSTFLVSANHLVPGSISVDYTQVNQNANRYIAQFLETGLPAVSTISTISRTATKVVINTVNPNPCAPGDLISVGGVADPSFDATYSVTTTPTNTAIDITILNGVAASSTGGSIGYLQSRFSQRNPEISHVQHQIAEGQIIPSNVTGTRLKRIKVTYDFASMTYDQAMRLLQYEIYRDLGLDQTPYTPPWGLTLSLFSESVDSSMRALKAQLMGDIITLDPSIFYEFGGDYEIMERFFNPIQEEIEDATDGSFLQPMTRSGAFNQGTDSNSGILKLVLRSYNPSSIIFTDTSVAAISSYATVPGQLPYGGGGTGSGSAPTGTVSVTSAGVVTVSWPVVTVSVSSTLLSYTAGSTTYLHDLFNQLSPIKPGDQNTYLFVLDQTSTGGSGKVFVMDTPGGYAFQQGNGSLVVTLCFFTVPAQPASGQPPNVSTFPIA